MVPTWLQADFMPFKASFLNFLLPRCLREWR